VLHFSSNEQYLAWEVARVLARLELVQRADADPRHRKALVEVIADQNDERILAFHARRQAIAAGIAIPFHNLVERFQLRPLDEDIFFICLAPLLSAQALLAMGIAAERRLAPSLELGLVCHLAQPLSVFKTCLANCESAAPLRRAGLLFSSIDRRSVGPTADSTRMLLAMPHFVARLVQGADELDPRLRAVATLSAPEGRIRLTPELRQKLDDLLSAFAPGAPPLVPQRWLLFGPPGGPKRSAIRYLAAHFERPLMRLQLAMVNDPELIEIAAANARLLRCTLHLQNPERLGKGVALRHTLFAMLERWEGLALIESSETEVLDELTPLLHASLAIEAPDTDARLAIWKQALPAENAITERELCLLSTRFELDGHRIQGAVDWALQKAHGKALDAAAIESSARDAMRAKLPGGHLRRTQLGLDDLVLPEKSLKRVRELLDACRQRAKVMSEWGFGKRLVTGRGLVTLFSGEAGTGKTLCAEILANELDMPLMLVSIPTVVSQFVGETEKNLQEVFRQARAHASLLLFDEADAFFAKRVQVEQAQDHYQNMEVNVLLQEVERFDGVLVLTTNLVGNMDRAFERRILFRIDFPEPDRKARARLWPLLLPPQLPRADDIDFEVLAEDFELTGGLIKNAIVRAAYRCAARGVPLDHDALYEAALRQTAATGRLTRHFD
jgi:AAA+ superfamily predicted ATPase